MGEGPDLRSRDGAAAAVGPRDEERGDGSAEEKGLGAAAGASAAAAQAQEGDAARVAELRRLLGEKAELLATGIYTREDAVIVELDAQIQAVSFMQSFMQRSE